MCDTICTECELIGIIMMVAVFDIDISDEKIVQTFYQDIYRIAYRLVGNEDDALDLTQETFQNVLNVRAQGTVIEQPRAYLITALKNLFFRRIKVAKREERVENIEEFVQKYSDMVLDENPEPIDSELIQRGISSLDKHFRLPLILYYYNELSYEQISGMLNIPIGTVMSRLSRAKRFLKIWLNKNGFTGISGD